MYGGFITLNGLFTVKFNFTNINEDLDFIVFQAHSHLHGITLYKNVNLPKSQVFGTNVGLLSFTKPMEDTYYLVNSNVNVTVRVYISVHGYQDTGMILYINI